MSLVDFNNVSKNIPLVAISVSFILEKFSFFIGIVALSSLIKSTRDTGINAKIAAETDKINNHFTAEIAKINARDVNYIAKNFNTITTKLNEIKQILEQHQK